MDLEELAKALSGQPQERLCWFASRCALRALPFLAAQGSKVLRRYTSTSKHLFAVFRAVNVALWRANFASIATSSTAAPAFFSFAARATNAASEAAAFFTSSVNYSSSSDVATSASFASASDAVHFVGAKNAAIAAHSAFVASHSDTALDTASAIAADLQFVTNQEKQIFLQWSSLWPQGNPKSWNEKFQVFQQWLNEMGLTYWAEELNEWLSGRFDRERMERCLFMPESTIAAGVPAMLAYLQATELVNLAEARVLFLGEGGAGKTSLIRCFHGEPIRGDEPATPRVEIRQQEFKIGDEPVNVHYWDFGGQVVMHATHQFFLREQTIYVVVLDVRRCDSLEYWLDHIRYFATGAPTLIVLNKVDQLPFGVVHPPFDFPSICQRYPFVIAPCFLISCDKGQGLDQLTSALHQAILSNCILRRDTPTQWFQVKKALGEINRDFIERAVFHHLCQEQQLDAKQEETALTVLDKLGVAIYFPKLMHTDVVLNPEWITKAIYFIIWASERHNCQGQLSVATLRHLFATGSTAQHTEHNSFLDVQVPEDKYAFLLDLMVEFKLAFRLVSDSSQYCVPMLASLEAPGNLARNVERHFSYRFPFLPSGLFFRFIAESGAELADGSLWRQGAVLQQGTSQVLVEYSEYQRCIDFYAQGERAGEYLTVLRRRLGELIGSNYKELPVEPNVITPEGARIDWRSLVLRVQAEGEKAREWTPIGEYLSLQLFQHIVGQVDAIPALRDEIMRLQGMVMGMGSFSVQVNPTFTPVFQNRVQVTTAISVVIQPLCELKSRLQSASEAVADFKEDEPDIAVQHQATLTKIERQLARLCKDIDEVASLPEDSHPVTTAQRDSILNRMKGRWDEFTALAKQINDVAALGGKIGDVVQASNPLLDQVFQALSQFPMGIV